MTDDPKHPDTDLPENDAAYVIPKISAHDNPYVATMGMWPGDINDGFEKAVREMRDNELVKEPPPWW